jgi:serine/threonine-protein kinase
MKEFSRRRFVLGTAAVAATGALAGCSGNGGGNGNGNGNGGGNGGGGDPQSRADEFLSGGDANLYDGSFADHTGQDEVTVSVGAGDNGFSFDPPAIRIDTGTTIVWEWTGRGGGHNVVSQDASDFEFSNEGEQIIDEEGHTYEHTFEESGVAAWVCIPHRAQGMYGAAIVE